MTTRTEEVHRVLDALSAVRGPRYEVETGCLSVRRQLELHAGYEPRAVDRQDEGAA